MTDQEILDSLKYGERINLECKKAESKIPSSVWETYSSFANTNGGLILFGVEEHNKEKDPDKLEEIISKVGPGYQRFRLQEQLYALLEKGNKV